VSCDASSRPSVPASADEIRGRDERRDCRLCLAKQKNLPISDPYPRIATDGNPTRNSGQTSCPSLTRSQQRTKSEALTEKEATVTTVADSKTYAEILRDIPAFASYASDVLDQFVTEKVFTVHTAAGREIRSATDGSDNLYVVVAGSASLNAGDGVRVALEAGDYFGGDRRHKLSASVVAEENVEVLVISADEIVRLQHAASRRQHPSNVEWAPEVITPRLRLLPSRRRFAVLARSGS
jgi:hypothetical protein